MKLSTAEMDILIPIVRWVYLQCSPAKAKAEEALLAKLQRMRKDMEETNELEASEN